MKSTDKNRTTSNKRAPTKGQRTPQREMDDTEGDMKDNPLHKAMLDELADLQNAEEQLVTALPQMIELAQSEDLRSAIQNHLQETEQHVQRLQEVATSLGDSFEKKTCEAMRGLLTEATRLAEEFEGSPALDAVLISAAQKVEHYEIASYGTVCAWARQMGHDEVVELLEQTLEEEKTADDKLTEIAETLANATAEEEDE